MDEVMKDLRGLEDFFDKSGRGVWVQASTLGSLEALLDFLKSSKIPVRGVNIGPVFKRDIMQTATMLEKAPEYAVVLCFDVTVDKDARKLAEELNVKIFEGEWGRCTCALQRLIMNTSLHSPNYLSPV